MPKPPTKVMRLPEHIVKQAKAFGAMQSPPRTPGEMLAVAWEEFKKNGYGAVNG